jgi:BirA family biotin operon repressor/biotin-[acetyl-CoA-carboxylase] ligase
MKWHTYYFDSVSSTNKIAQDKPIGSVIIARQQTDGYGRHGRHWISPVGNLYLSAVVPDFGSTTPLLAFVSGVAVAESLSDFHPYLKWPNDILINKAKVAGILLEKTEHNSVIIGIGVNVVSAPTTQVIYATTHLAGKIDLKTLIDSILENLKKNILLFQEQGFETIRNKWLNYAFGIGQKIQVHLPNAEIIGIFKEISPQGELVLETPNKTIQNIIVGDVFFKDNQ